MKKNNRRGFVQTGEKNKGRLYFIVLGVVSMIWFLLRVLPKPDRITYPCQRVAAANTVAFLSWLFGSAVAVTFFRKAYRTFVKRRFVYGAGLSFLALIAWAVVIVTTPGDNALAAFGFNTGIFSKGEAFVPSDSANTPVGTAKGIHPGRVSWAHDPEAVSYDPEAPQGKFWEDKNTDPRKVDNMWNGSLDAVSGATTTYSAWEKLFQFTNKRQGKGEVNYTKGEKIAIKINWSAGLGHPTFDDLEPVVMPQLLMSVISDLIGVAGVSGSDITVYDVSAYIHDDIMAPFKNHENPEYSNVAFVGNPKWLQSEPGRYIAAEADMNAPIHFADETVVDVFWVKSITESDYLINIANFKAHDLAGVTFCAKNLYGSIFIPTYSLDAAGDNYLWGFGPYNETDTLGNRDSHQGLHKCIAVDDYPGLGGLDKRPYGSYNYLVDILGHPQIHDKTLLYVVDAFYGGIDQKTIGKFESFDNQYSSSLFMSQDVIALESVCLDFLNAEPNVSGHLTGNVDNYLHEAAMADNPPSGEFYDPGNTGARLASLGVHEHWNNPSDKQYSRNLGTGEGIELFQVDLSTGTERLISQAIMHYSVYPNPFSSTTTLVYRLDRESGVRIDIYDQSGRLVHTMVDDVATVGTHEIQWDASGLPAGIYYASLQTSYGSTSIKIIKYGKE